MTRVDRILTGLCGASIFVLPALTIALMGGH